jgi:hypothetical protein
MTAKPLLPIKLGQRFAATVRQDLAVVLAVAPSIWLADTSFLYAYWFISTIDLIKAAIVAVDENDEA